MRADGVSVRSIQMESSFKSRKRIKNEKAGVRDVSERSRFVNVAGGGTASV